MIRSNMDFADPHRRSSATISRLRSCGSIERRTSRLSPRGACEAIAQRVNVDEDIGESEAVLPTQARSSRECDHLWPVSPMTQPA
jgi:hypothetical protein